MKVLIGLGNPGIEYAKTRHNVGFMVLDQLVEEQGETWKKDSKLKSEVAKIKINEEDYLLAKPQTMMNLSGEAAVQIASYFKLPKEDITIIYDDLDLPTGDIRIRTSGSAGTHNGMKSILQHLGTEEINRIRIGIESRGDSAPKQQDTSSYVLSNFGPEEKEKIDKSIAEVIANLKGTSI
ncbi:aminoacyl-tRNA hydrolase [Candidatus Peregrinibacteria bacterium]|jgi:peptidyl-tRNA hydrolase, PTH1 family|nr:aminoacyl-tRNA hydrolase [Candidatus Peregrinibacteria bacterium]MBT4055688.1 aminoacyl-tRNA hydrolase [Candidatus Peregrinibacteria bacterium]